MKEKEKLLKFETPLKFMFSHSALREGSATATVRSREEIGAWQAEAYPANAVVCLERWGMLF